MVGRDLDAAEGGAEQRSTMDPAARQRTVMGLRHSPWLGDPPAPKCYAIRRVSRRRQRQRRKLLEPGLVGGPTGGWVAARAASRWARIWGMTCSVLPTRDCQPHWQLPRRWPRSVGAAGLTVTLCPATCSLTEMVTAHPRIGR
jgi:hypothetical protein